VLLKGLKGNGCGVFSLNFRFWHAYIFFFCHDLAKTFFHFKSPYRES